ncbi:MAG: hypothetical protein ACTSXH_08745 [Promethearchaeota archaeon]
MDKSNVHKIYLPEGIWTDCWIKEKLE